ncbi:hypothetical protein ANN_08697 [Periplaneta americana]|uniref:PiggyBac transposable element-derived protein domain-containing protein n=1 Tax=Periplaneta americana TaxID=6978 RepID=A0ABQ8T3S5_PERAM|nr:hypothetical protein ANN_08697 [Periplaneta americana]
MDSSETIPNSGVDVVLLLPLNANDDLTDEDSGAEDNPCVDNLRASQLSADVFATDIAINNECEDSSYDIGLPSTIKEGITGTQAAERETTGEPENEDSTLPSTEWPLMCEVPLKPDEEILNMMVTYINQYAAKKNRVGDCSENEMMIQVGRFSREKKLRIAVPQPHLFESYNNHMGGIYRGDQNVSLYRTSIREKKWYFPIIAHLIDVAEQNACLLYRPNEENIDHLSLQRRVATAILKSNKRGSHQQR